MTYHNQLFDTLQLDLYDSYTFFMDKHIGRAEIRLQNLEGMPEIFTSYYEVLEKKLSIGATSQVSRKALMTSGVGAIQAQLAYQYISSIEPPRTICDGSVDLSEMNWLIDQQTQALSTDKQNLSDQELILEFNLLLKNQRKNQDIQFKKFEQDYQDDSTDNDNISSTNTSSDETYNNKQPLTVSRALSDTSDNKKDPKINTLFGTVSSFFGYPNNTSPPSPPTESKEPLAYNVLNTDDESLKSFPILDTIGSWTMAKETSQVLRAIGKLLVAFVSMLSSTFIIFLFIIAKGTRI